MSDLPAIERPSEARPEKVIDDARMAPPIVSQARDASSNLGNSEKSFTTEKLEFHRRAAAIFTAGVFTTWALGSPGACAQTTVPIQGSDIGGVVRSANGPEPGVWVIAETRELPTRFARMVATDDQGRFVVPNLPQAHYQVWVRGYGLINSPKSAADPGKQLNLTAVIAPNDTAAAQYYPAVYWYSMLKFGVPTSSAVMATSRHPSS